MTITSTSKTPASNKGFICIFTLDRIEELRRFLTSFHKHNSLPICILLAKDTADAHRLKTKCAFYSPFDFTCMLDIDMLINGNLDNLFSITPKDRIGIVRERGVKCLNSGVLVFSTSIMKNLCLEWNKIYERKLIKGFSGKQGTWDQDVLIPLLEKYPYKELPPVYNHILKDYSPDEELAMFDFIKIFHFLHASDVDRNKYASYQAFMAL